MLHVIEFVICGLVSGIGEQSVRDSEYSKDGSEDP